MSSTRRFCRRKSAARLSLRINWLKSWKRYSLSVYLKCLHSDHYLSTPWTCLSRGIIRAIMRTICKSCSYLNIDRVCCASCVQTLRFTWTTSGQNACRQSYSSTIWGLNCRFSRMSGSSVSLASTASCLK